MMTLKNIEYWYKKKDRAALNIDNLEIKDGEKIAIMGLNGAGKTTLVELILGLRAGYKGEIVKDKKYTYNAVFQDSNFIGEVKLKDIFYMYCDLYKVKKDHKKYFKEFDILDVENHFYKKVSGGQQQKFKFLIALLNEPDFLVLDEIATSLDYIWRNKIIDVINEEVAKREGNTLLLVSHNPDEIAKVCTRVIQLKHGKIINDIYLKGTEKQKLSLIEKMAVSDHV